MNVIEELYKRQDIKYRDFNLSLIPNVDLKHSIGVRSLEIKKLAKIMSAEERKEFISMLPHYYFEEDMLHTAILSDMKEFNMQYIEDFLPYINNWAVCDSLKPKSFKKHPDEVMEYIKKWLKSDSDFTVRFGLITLMTFYLDENYRKEYLELPLTVESLDYYVKMAEAWFYQCALVKHYDEAIIYLEENRLNDFVHNKTISKCNDSFRIDKQKKEYLKTLRRK
ncbi:MAG: DNA alkylation repair protein [Erysipelotrichaceae bacterium]